MNDRAAGIGFAVALENELKPEVLS